jgi:hypothetical protein
MKRCFRCKQEKSLDSFNAKQASSDGRQSKCKDCSNELAKVHYIANHETYKSRARKREKDLLVQIQALKAGPCADCKRAFPPYVMDFDHRDAKKKVGSVSRLRHAGWSMSRILDEISKCDLVCANCHRIRTHERQSGTSTKSQKTFK